MGLPTRIPEAIGSDIEIEIREGDEVGVVAGVITDVRELNDGRAELDICLVDGGVVTVALTARQYAGLIGSDALPPAN